ncbi:MAG: DUF2065 family protein [Candidatus Marinimicrobia bacterium]|nr:DUF2065 family protein [Candidatus Neomarinimicrobiota bacterium]
MIPFYLLESLLFLIFGLMLVFKSVLVRNLLNYLREKNLYIIPGIIEIILGLLTLYFRHETKFGFFVFLVGILLFIDGVFYLLMSDKLSSTIEWIQKLEDKSYRLYGLFIIITAAGLAASAFFLI